MIELSWPQVSARRLERQALAAPREGGTPADVVAAMCGAHAQVMSAAELSIALRLDGVTRADVRRALWEERSLVKTYGPRGTVHLLPARDLPSWVDALSRLPLGHHAFPDGVRMTAGQTAEVIEAIRVVLDGRELTIDELGDAVVGATGPWAGDLVMPAFQTMWPRWRQAMAAAAHHGALVFGPPRGRKVTYTSPPPAPASPALSGSVLPMGGGGASGHADGTTPGGGGAVDGAVELLRRYLAGYGPATPEQFAQWIGAPRAWAEGLFEAAGPQPVSFQGGTAWVLPGDTAAPAQAPGGVRLLPYFDAYVVAGRPRELLYPGAARRRALAGGQAGNFPVLLVDGTVAGVWHQRRSGRRIHVTVEALRPLTRAQRGELDDQVARVGEILEGRPELTLGPVTVGPHA
ncbi:winged helix DNA-binding domain-containing protein [Nonomuraea indica]|uniref:winged helix DNA-binding domain-containing protein n=1 Tax=Nonomuraea indica TaxID=1581193 RepID=UPI000C7C6716|nr:winged helix DNA-binding domain-containing protein [Nonomuraea indica]